MICPAACQKQLPGRNCVRAACTCIHFQQLNMKWTNWHRFKYMGGFFNRWMEILCLHLVIAESLSLGKCSGCFFSTLWVTMSNRFCSICNIHKRTGYTGSLVQANTIILSPPYLTCGTLHTFLIPSFWYSLILISSVQRIFSELCRLFWHSWSCLLIADFDNHTHTPLLVFLVL